MLVARFRWGLGSVFGGRLDGHRVEMLPVVLLGLTANGGASSAIIVLLWAMSALSLDVHDAAPEPVVGKAASQAVKVLSTSNFSVSLNTSW